ncbi:MAG: 1-deoxy-D-xylulose-5-phosphate reductoisomerase [Oscillospiraceae bacterium]|nr:1-deoxy-D-xylulose-5-phosphate reductoisomerase [Oscillospiraceae bacterium]
MKTLTVLGSTGSIGRQTLEVARHLGIRVVGLTAYNNRKLLDEQAREFGVRPDMTALGSEPDGEEAICRVAAKSGADIIVTAIAGEAGLRPTLAALSTGKRVALANKEPLVCAGDIVMQTARKHNAQIIPVDSEHSAIFQCLAERRQYAESSATSSSGAIKKITLTASGGPFRGFTRDKLSHVTPEDALRHPNWNMGQKITVDSATMMNKGLELIEATYLFGVTPDQIEVVIHPQSIIHSMVEFADGSTIAQLSNPDMRMPIQYALTYPGRLPGLVKPLNLIELGSLTFEKPDLDAFSCLALAQKAARYDAAHGSCAACKALNRANEEAVALFLNGSIGFLEIAEHIKNVLSNLQHWK